MVCLSSCIIVRNTTMEKLQPIVTFDNHKYMITKSSFREYNFLDLKLRYRLKFEIKALLLLINK